MLIKKDRRLLSSTTRVSLDILHNRSHIYIYIPIGRAKCLQMSLFTM